ncbi:MAG: hypothetical protein JWM31_2358 [Solirubrobacterales bacterium]|nr:hypothetical protein [Solirubrobacterales bacterium]
MAAVPPFAELAAAPIPALDELALALAVELRPPGSVDVAAALRRLDALADELRGAVAALADPDDVAQQAAACRDVLGDRHRFDGDREQYDHPDNSMLDLVLERRRGLPILLSVVYAETARRAGLPVAGVGLPGHFVVGHFGAEDPILLDPFNHGAEVGADADTRSVRPWATTEIAMRMLNNLVGAYVRRRDLPAAIRAAELRLLLPADDGLRRMLTEELDALEAERE